MSTYMDGPKTIEQTLNAIEEITGLAQKIETSYVIKQLKGYADILFERYAPFYPGDKVVLTKAPVIGDDHGWKGREHFMVVGAEARVDSVDVYDGQFNVHLSFKNETWKDTDGNEREVSKKGLFRFKENSVRVIEAAERKHERSNL